MTIHTVEEQYSDEKAERRTQEAIHRSFQTSYKPQREMVGKTGRPSLRKSMSSKVVKKAE